MNEQFEEVEPAELIPGDVVHVSFKSGAEQALYLNEKVIAVRDSYVSTEEGHYFWKEYSHYYLVESAKKPLPTELGAVVEHFDGWKFVRVGKDDWCGVDPGGERSTMPWRDEEVSCEDWKEL